MAFHIPPSGKWEPAQISSELCERGLNACVFGNEVRITLSNSLQTTPTGFFSRFLLRRPQVLKIQYNPLRFLINVELVWDSLRDQDVFDQSYDAIYDAMSNRGYLEACTDFTGRDLAKFYCGNDERILRIFDEIDELQRNRETLVTRQDFESAAKNRVAQYELESELDAILLSSHANR